MKFHLIALLAALLLPFCIAEENEEEDGGENYLNVYGESLQECSEDGMARAGYTDSGYCVDDDAYSYYMCMDVSTLNSGDLCDATGEDGCSAEWPCHDNDEENCSIQNWCVSQNQFMNYVQSRGDCNSISNIYCDSINIDVVKNLINDAQQSGNTGYHALFCLKNRCGLNLKNDALYGVSYTAPDDGFNNWFAKLFFVGVIGVIAVVVWYHRQARKRHDYDEDDDDDESDKYNDGLMRE